jgi:hypothetical protein
MTKPRENKILHFSISHWVGTRKGESVPIVSMWIVWFLSNCACLYNDRIMK